MNSLLQIVDFLKSGGRKCNLQCSYCLSDIACRKSSIKYNNGSANYEIPVLFKLIAHRSYITLYFLHPLI
jgi:MoaA/NifB/PqqE/SkfB family radical SAM enzyme